MAQAVVAAQDAREATATMQAIVQSRYGGPETLRLEAVAKPVAGPGEVLVRVHAAGAGPDVWHLMTGLPLMIRIMGFGFRAPKVRVRGRDLAGRIVAVGQGVTQLEPGDEVFGTAEGTFAEYAVARADRIAPKPSNLTFERAAAAPISGVTALQAVRDVGRVRPGQKVLVIGAAGGVGSFTVQIAKAFGAHVTGASSTSKLDLVRSIGADDVIDRTREDLTDGRRRFDVIVDTAGRRPIARLRRALTAHGTLVIVGGEGGDRWMGGFQRGMTAPLRGILGTQKLRSLVSSENRPDLLALRDLIETGKVTPLIDRTYPLARAAEAIGYLAEGHARGKIVITI